MLTTLFWCIGSAIALTIIALGRQTSYTALSAHFSVGHGSAASAGSFVLTP
jgi:hypothetical protein